MTRRLLYPNYWAEQGTATDPDTDTTHPSYRADRYEEHGWHSEKPPEDWQNFLTQITDQKVIAAMAAGIPYWDASVTYNVNSVCTHADKFYVCQTVTALAPDVANSGWFEILETNRAAYLALVAAMNKLITDHLAADNPHHDTMAGLVGGGYEKPQVDTFFGSATDPKTIVYHKLQTGAGVHGETAASVGTLPTTGGTFTGDVIFLDEAIVQLTPSKSVHYNKSTALFEIVNGTYSLGVDPSGNGYLVSSTGATLLISEGNMDSLVVKYNNQFALPAPVWSANFESDISDGNSIGCWTLETSATPVFVDGGLKVDNNTCIISFDNAAFPITLVMSVKDVDGTWRFPVVDYPTWTMASNTTNLFTLAKQMYPAYNPECVGFYKVYPRLSAYQKTMLVNK